MGWTLGAPARVQEPSVLRHYLFATLARESCKQASKVGLKTSRRWGATQLLRWLSRKRAGRMEPFVAMQRSISAP